MTVMRSRLFLRSAGLAGLSSLSFSVLSATSHSRPSVVAAVCSRASNGSLSTRFHYSLLSHITWVLCRT